MTTGDEKLRVEVIKRFDKCPDCGSTDRMMDRLGKEMKEQGLISEDMEVGLVEVGGPLVDPTKVGQMLTVSVRPGIFALRDICIGCGRQVTVKIERKMVEVNLQMLIPGTGPLLPGRGN